MTNFAHIFSSVYAALMVNTEMASNWPVIPKKKKKIQIANLMLLFHVPLPQLNPIYLPYG